MFERLQSHFRSFLLKKLRPGKNQQELLSLIGRAEAIQSDEQRRMFEGMIEFHDTRVREVMMPRSDIQAIDLETPLHEVHACIAKSGVTRLPVMQGDLDHIVGVIHVWDIFQAQAEEKNGSVKTLMRPHLTVSELEYIPGLLSEMRESKNHIAIVLDEFGGTAGLVTLSDILEEIVGSLEEGDKTEVEDYRRVDHGALEVQARMHIEDLEDVLDMHFPTGSFDTVGGLIVTELGRIPVRGERLLVAGLDMHVQEADPRRVIQVLIKPKHNQ